MHKLTKISSGILFVVVSTFLGCGNLDGTKPSTSTQSPTAEQIQHCREIMYINPDVAITADGHCADYGFQDNAIHFKFTTSAKSIDEIFEAGIVPPGKLGARQTIAPPRYGLADNWWNPSGQSQIGGDFIVPDPQTGADRGLNIGIDTNQDGTFTVYVSWFDI